MTADKNSSNISIKGFDEAIGEAKISETYCIQEEKRLLYFTINRFFFL